MPAKKLIPINGDVLRWAMEEGGFTPGGLAARIGVGPADIGAWLEGTGAPTKGQFSKLAAELRRPSAIFFLPSVPREASLTAEFRSAPGRPYLEPDELRQIRWARRVQQLAGAIINEVSTERPVTRLPQASRTEAAADVASRFRDTIGITVEEQMAWPNDSVALHTWRDALEEQGAYVLQLQLGKGGVRGFSALDPFAPVIGINTHYNNAARIFTMMHEAAHLLLRDDSACAQFIGPGQSAPTVERWCEEFAANFLLPSDAVRRFAAAMQTRDDLIKAVRIANKFKTSVRASALRLREMRLAAADIYDRVEREIKYLDDKREGGGGGGQPRMEKRFAQFGERLMGTFAEAVREGKLSEHEARDYLRIAGPDFDELNAAVATGGRERGLR